MKYYINFKYHNLDIETIDETNSFKEAIFLLKNYRMSGDGSYWISKRATKEYYKN